MDKITIIILRVKRSLSINKKRNGKQRIKIKIKIMNKNLTNDLFEFYINEYFNHYLQNLEFYNTKISGVIVSI
jgi:hypothetical protein